MRKVPQVFILGIVGLAVDLERDVVRFGVIYLFLAALDAPFAPGSDYLHAGGERLYGKLEPHLVVSLSGAAVADGVGFFGDGDLGKPARYHGARHGGAKQIPFVFCARLHGGDYDLFHEFLGEIFHVKLGSAGPERALLEPFELVRLTDVAGDGDNFGIIIVFLEPRDDDRGIEPARISEHYFFDIFFCHYELPPPEKFKYYIYYHARSENARGNCNIIQENAFFVMIYS